MYFILQLLFIYTFLKRLFSRYLLKNEFQDNHNTIFKFREMDSLFSSSLPKDGVSSILKRAIVLLHGFSYVQIPFTIKSTILNNAVLFFLEDLVPMVVGNPITRVLYYVCINDHISTGSRVRQACPLRFKFNSVTLMITTILKSRVSSLMCS